MTYVIYTLLNILGLDLDVFKFYEVNNLLKMKIELD